MAMVMWIDPRICALFHPLTLYLFCCDDPVTWLHSFVYTLEQSIICSLSSHELEGNFTSLFGLMAPYGKARFDS